MNEKSGPSTRTRVVRFMLRKRSTGGPVTRGRPGPLFGGLTWPAQTRRGHGPTRAERPQYALTFASQRIGTVRPAVDAAGLRAETAMSCV